MFKVRLSATRGRSPSCCWTTLVVSIKEHNEVRLEQRAALNLISSGVQILKKGPCVQCLSPLKKKWGKRMDIYKEQKTFLCDIERNKKDNSFILDENDRTSIPTLLCHFLPFKYIKL